MHRSRVALLAVLVSMLLILGRRYGGPGSPVIAATVATDTVQLHGHVVSVHANALVLRLRDGRRRRIDIVAARATHRTGGLSPGAAVVVYGTRGADGMFHAVSIGRTNSNWHTWPPDS